MKKILKTLSRGQIIDLRNSQLQLTDLTDVDQTLATTTHSRKNGMLFVSAALVFAVSMVALIISGTPAFAEPVNTITSASLIAAKQNASVGGIAVGSIGIAALLAFAAITLHKPKHK